jgi:hypothetical protein
MNVNKLYSSIIKYTRARTYTGVYIHTCKTKTIHANIESLKTGRRRVTHLLPRGGARVHFKIDVFVPGWAATQTPYMSRIVPRRSAQIQTLCRRAKFDIVQAAGIILLRARQTHGTCEPSLGSPDDVRATDSCDEESDEQQDAHIQAE